MSITKISSVNIDVDPVVCYYEIYGINKNTGEDNALYMKAIPRCLDLLKKHDIRATFFITARENNESTIQMIKRIREEGHEIASHSHSHDYGLAKMRGNELDDDLGKNESFIEGITGEKPAGFRAPGYNISSELIGILKKRGYSYDSSSLPSPLYFFGKWFFLKLKKILKTESKSYIHSQSTPFDSSHPYRLGDLPARSDKNSALIEFPISSIFLVPFIGTTIILLPRIILSTLISFLSRKKFINIELHMIDFADKSDSPVYNPILAQHPGLKQSAESKAESIGYVLSVLKKKGYSFKTLADCTKYF